MRYQSAIPMSSFRGDDVGLFRRKRRRRVRREAKRLVDQGREATLERLPAPAPSREDREPRREDREWGPLTRLGQQMRVQARRGYRAAVVELQPGMYLVAEVPEEALKPEVGVVPLLAPLLTMAAARALKKRRDHRRELEHRHIRRHVEVLEPEVIYEPPPRQLPGPRAVARWADPSDVRAVFEGYGCRGCGG